MTEDVPAGGIEPSAVETVETTFSEWSIDDKLEYLAGTLSTVQQQVAWLCEQLYQAMEAVKSNPMLRKVMGG